MKQILNSGKKTTKKKKKILTPEERKRLRNERIYKNNISTVFKNADFRQIASRDQSFFFDGSECELDAIFVYENIIVITEDTCSDVSSNINEHLRKKGVIFKRFLDDQDNFIQVLSNKFDGIRNHFETHEIYNRCDYKLIFVYCSRNYYDDTYKKDFPFLVYLDYPHLRYFLSIAKTIQKSSRYELFKFLNLSLADIGYKTGQNHKIIDGFLLPEAPSGMEHGYKVVSFYIDPHSLIPLSYVLRKDGGWRDQYNLYQRLIIKNKIKLMREYLSKDKRAFINNIIVTLPSEAKLIDNKGDTLNDKGINKKEAQHIKLQIPMEFNTIGIVDGQHRVFAYHEGLDKHETKIAQLRMKQNLLLTGVVYPVDITDDEKLAFESKLFLEINDKQSRVKADLKQAIATLVNPFDSIAISKKVITSLGTKGPLQNLLEIYFFDEGKIKTSSIVSYGLRHIVKVKESSETFFYHWNESRKNDLLLQKDRTLLDLYIAHCVSEINKFLVAYKIEMEKRGFFTRDYKISRALSLTAINGLIFCLRNIIQDNKLGDLEYYSQGLAKTSVDYSPNFIYKSSHWKQLGDKLYSECF